MPARLGLCYVDTGAAALLTGVVGAFGTGAFGAVGTLADVALSDGGSVGGSGGSGDGVEEGGHPLYVHGRGGGCGGAGGIGTFCTDRGMASRSIDVDGKERREEGAF